MLDSLLPLTRWAHRPEAGLLRGESREAGQAGICGYVAGDLQAHRLGESNIYITIKVAGFQSLQDTRLIESTTFIFIDG